MTPTIQQVNHDLNLLYALGRIYLPKQILEALLYGEDFDEPKESDTETLKQLIKANKKEEGEAAEVRGEVRRETKASSTDTLAEGLFREELWNSIYE